jgi:CHAT domain
MGNGGMAMARGLTYLDFDVVIERADQGAYRVRVVNAPAGPTSWSTFTMPFSQLELKYFVLKIGRPRRVVRRVDDPDTAAIKTFGSQLYRELFHHELEVNLLRSQILASTEGKGLRLRLRLSDTPELAELPWEFLYDRSRNRFVCLADRTPLVRFLEVPDPPRPLRVSPPLRVLVMISSPRDASFAELDVEQEWAKLHGVLSGLEQAGLVQLERLETATLSALRQHLRRDDWHVLHFIGHGGFDTHAKDGVLVLEDEAGGSRLVTAQALGVPLHNHDALRLVVLNACEGARSDPTDPFAGTAQTLIQQGIPAVVAMQFEITDRAAIAFTSELYAAVADGYPLDAALSQARQAIYTDVSEIEWATPVLYLRAPDGHIFDVTPTIRPPSGEERSRVRAEREAAELRERETAEREAAELRERETAEREAAELRERETAEREATELRERVRAERERAEREATELRERKAAEWRAAQLRTASDGVDRADELLRRRNYPRAIAVCTEVRREFGNSADPAIAAHVARARELLRRARQQQARRRLRRWGAVGIAAAVAAGSYLGWRTNGTGPEERRVELLGTRDWTDTGVDCKAGEALEIAASGSIYHSNKNKRGTSVGPNGDPDPSRRRANIPGLPDAKHAALIGSIARQQPYFVVGRSTVYACPGEGRLFLGINDRDVANNGGRFSATIKR